MGKTVLYQFENDYREIDCGMFYAIRCRDGSFFLIDSAHQDSYRDHIRIHDFLKSLVPEGEKIRIAGWFFSHAHQDHIVKFMDFLKTDYTDCEIECLYYNFPDPDGPSSEYWKESDRVTMREFASLMEERDDLKKYTPHTGDEIRISNLKIDVLVTWEDIAPEPIERFNDSSTVIMIEAEGQKIFLPGDAGEVEAKILTERYGESLKADILQLSHHGFRGGSVKLYELVNAPVVLVSTEKKRLEENLERETTKKALELAEEYFIAGEGTVALELPYKTGTAKKYPKEVNR